MELKLLEHFEKKRWIESLDSRRMLEIGCASGSFMHEMAVNGWEVEGLEISKASAEAARSHGYKVYTGSLEEAPDMKDPFDLITGWMVLEHLHDPVISLEKLFRWTRPGGYLVLSVPNAASFEFKLFKERWYALQLPTHLHHFTPGTLKNLLDGCGWNLKKVIYQMNFKNVIVSTGYFFQEKGWFENFSKLLVQGRHSKNILSQTLALLSRLLHQSGRITLLAQRGD